MFPLSSIKVYCSVFNYSNDIALGFWTLRLANFMYIFCNLQKSVMHSIFSIMDIVQDVICDIIHSISVFQIYYFKF